MKEITFQVDDLLNGVHDHELDRLPVTKALHDAVDAACAAQGIRKTEYIRHALVAKLRRDSKRLT